MTADTTDNPRRARTEKGRRHLSALEKIVLKGLLIERRVPVALAAAAFEVSEQTAKKLIQRELAAA